MKKIIILITMAFTFNSLSARTSEINSIKNNSFPKEINNIKLQKIKIRKIDFKIPICHVCCTVQIWNPDGSSITITACAGWFLTSCETAAERACAKANNQAEEILN